LAEFLSTAGLYVNDITMNVDYSCCDGSSASPKTATAEEESLFLNMRSPNDVAKLPDLYVGIMVDAASKMVSDCPK
jgi:hypothetical protein